MASSSGRRTTVVGRDVKVSENKPMARPGRGRLGNQITVETNFFRLIAPNLREIYQYCVFVDAMRVPEKNQGGQPDNGSQTRVLCDIAPSAFMGLNRALFSAWCRKCLPGWALAYDGRKTAYAPREIPTKFVDTVNNNRGFPFEVDQDGLAGPNSTRTETVYVRIRKVAVVDCRSILSNAGHNTMEQLAALAAVDTVLGTGPLKTHVPVGRSFYHPEGFSDLGNGIQAWRGFYQSARLSSSGLLVNMDESRTPFWGGGGTPLLDLLDEMRLDLSRMNASAKKTAAKALMGLKVRAVHSKITYRVHGFSSRGAYDEEFKDQDNNTVTVAHYFRSKYNIDIRDGHTPCVITNPKKKTMMPIELLYVQERQRLTRPMTPDQTANMIRCAAMKPHIRSQGAMQAMRRVNHDQDETCRAFGIKVEQRLMQVPARVLPPPTMQFNNGTQLPRFGAWNNRHEKRLFNPAPVHTWCVLNLTPARPPEVGGFVQALVRKGAELGMVMTPNPRIESARNHEIEHKLKQFKQFYDQPQNRVNKFPLQLVLIIKGRQDTETYNLIKRVGDLEIGVATQVMLAKHLRPRQQTYYGNLLLKINAKLGGCNAVPQTTQAPQVPFAKRRHIVLGADVTHPTGGGNRPSVAALVGSKDPTISQFTGSLRNLPARQELITEMYSMFREVYDRWLLAQPPQSRAHAEAIVMFRDGVSEGQFQQVMEEELESIRRACHDYHKSWNPKITYIIVTKRHHARFFPRREHADRSGNVPPGTVVDTHITSSQYYDFYLNSHSGIQGTSRPSKYTVLVDENHIGVDALQAYVYKLAHSYARCHRSVSIVNSAYYAHLLAFRGRAYLGEDGSDTASSSSGTTGAQQQHLPTIVLHDKLGKRLFFV